MSLFFLRIKKGNVSFFFFFFIHNTWDINNVSVTSGEKKVNKEINYWLIINQHSHKIGG